MRFLIAATPASEARAMSATPLVTAEEQPFLFSVGIVVVTSGAVVVTSGIECVVVSAVVVTSAVVSLTVVDADVVGTVG